MSVTKYDPSWQIARTKARSIKDPSKKIEFVLDFFRDNTNAYNYERVSNWLKTTAMAYKDPLVKALFQAAHHKIDTDDEFEAVDKVYDNTLKLADVSDDDLIMVYKDLSKRKYGFQFKNPPKDHIKFMADLEAELKRRSIRL